MCAVNYPDLKQSFLQVGGLLISLCLPCHYQPDWAAGHHDFLCLFLLGVCSPLKDEIPKAVLESETKYKESEEMYECRRYFLMPCYKCCSGPVGNTMVSCFTGLSGHWSASETVLFRMVFWSTTVVWSELPLKGAVATKWIWQWPDEHRCRDSLGFREHTGGKFSFDVYWYWRLDCRTWWLCSAEICVCIPLPAFSLGMEANKALGRKHLRNER